MQTGHMNKYIVWLSPTQGDFVNADNVREIDGFVKFEKAVREALQVVASYNLKNILGYKEVEEI